jgi:hypothetical protein
MTKKYQHFSILQRRSGEKKTHTAKNTIISTTDKAIMFVGQTVTGHNHDYKMLKEEFPPDKPWFRDINALLDLGYQGIHNRKANEFDNEIFIFRHRNLLKLTIE